MKTKSCFVCDKLHSLQFPKNEEVYTCDDHTYLNKEEAADYCGVTTRTITRAASNGLISTYLVDTGVEKSSIGGRRMNRYSLADIKKLVKKEVR